MWQNIQLAWALHIPAAGMLNTHHLKTMYQLGHSCGQSHCCYSHAQLLIITRETLLRGSHGRIIHHGDGAIRTTTRSLLLQYNYKHTLSAVQWRSTLSHSTTSTDAVLLCRALHWSAINVESMAVLKRREEESSEIRSSRRSAASIPDSYCHEVAYWKAYCV